METKEGGRERGERERVGGGKQVEKGEYLRPVDDLKRSSQLYK